MLFVSAPGQDVSDVDVGTLSQLSLPVIKCDADDCSRKLYSPANEFRPSVIQ